MNAPVPRTMKRQLFALIMFAGILFGIFSFFPDTFPPFMKASTSSLSQFLLILPAIILLTGIFSVAVSADMVKKNFGSDTGFLGSIKALIFGSLMSTGPFYMSFPIARSLLEKGAKISSVMIFVSAWNVIAIVAELVEFHYMGPAFMSIRLLLTSVCILGIGYATDSLFRNQGKKQDIQSK
jgi:uncharacterized membrane protein YraQ (UPF0718 family)